MVAIAQTHHPALALQDLTSRLGELVAARGAHPARTVVLLPFAHLLPLAREAWAARVPNGFAPRFETTRTWRSASGHVPQPDDLSFDMARDLLTARALIERAGLGAQSAVLAGELVQAAMQLAPLAAAVVPAAREAWAAQARQAIAPGFDAPQLAVESAVASLAIAWTAASTYMTDGLLDERSHGDVDLLVVVEGLRAEPFTRALMVCLAERVETLSLEEHRTSGQVALHTACDASDEAERAAACVLRHVQEGRVPVALAAIDRVLTRRIHAMLEQCAIRVRDETGWKLSTTRSAAHVMLALRACVHRAGTDAVIDWLKNAPAADTRAVLALERFVRRAGIREWHALRAGDLPGVPQGLVAQVNEWRQGIHDARSLPQWLSGLGALLRATGQWDWLQGDAAGQAVIQSLRLAEDAGAEFRRLPQAARRFTLAEFTSWVDGTLEAASFVPVASEDAQVAILPFQQLAGRGFAALVLPGCDEMRLPAAPEPPGAWTSSQRRQLGLPTREVLEEETRAAWRHALQTPVCDVLWRGTDASGEQLLPSPLVQSLQFAGAVTGGSDARPLRRLESRCTARPAANGRLLPLQQLSASAYEDLRRCPYRFFGARQLGLQEPDEIETELDKRDFGNWLHQVLRVFHESLAQHWEPAGPGRVQRLDAAAAQVTQAQRLDEGEFLPFAAAWPQVREGYLEWLAAHEAREGATFGEAESERQMELGAVKLVGRIDRIDRLSDGRVMVMDYKTEGGQVTAQRVKQPIEDTQLAFYAALLQDDSLRAAYVNVGERGETKTVEQVEVVQARDLLVHGIMEDMARIAAGASLLPLGEGMVCESCSVRGLCRKDFWS